MSLTPLQRTGLLIAVLAGAGLGTALASEYWGGLVPCALCLVERWPYRAAILFGALALASPRGARLMVALAALAMLASVAAAATHVGVEQAWWPSPLPECAAAPLGGGSLSDRLSRMPARPAKPCDEPTFLIPGLAVSMAGMNLALSAVLALFAATRTRSPA